MRTLFLLIALCAIMSVRVTAQDFASRFMMDLSCDTLVRCQTISPKMMAKLMDMQHSAADADVSPWVSKLRSARIITSSHNARKYFRYAAHLLEKNKQRFIPLNQAASQGSNLIFVRRKEDLIIELVMVNLDSRMKTLTIVNLTGDMDDEFIETLSDK